MRLKILIADDDEFLAGVMSLYLQSSGYDTVLVHTGSKVLAAVEETDPHLVLLDLSFGDANGLDVLADLKAKFPPIPVAIMTGFSFRPEVQQEASQRGAFGVFPKDGTFQDVFEQILQAWKNGNAS